ncbi:peptide-methionine (S)-S-oxide reductase MsrA [Pseudoglutamicibacter cumminsii]|uniref:peptide-methionine (S)-S-oxide reductase MsrA n=1 Tax=Pseudoglutamicibacter cumminsii TaxID=156979 RepID=UPI00255240AD|nr:peptide-methionine (S)-S-oxide reductase MsrA [Pseudoglutamicibacter cumminsii]MDK7082720.1 peptide-methionine (S)-S-oxide reductase MsrA [Pseudoglutamicibacter cumminsii]
MNQQSEHTIVMAGGCFWCLDAWFRMVRGVTHVESGYTGGGDAPADYYSVCTGTTGHAEAVAVTFDPSIISEDVVLDMFFTMHNPTTLNRQGYDVGTQYRSALFTNSPEQTEVFESAIERNQANWTDQIVTTIEPLGPWYTAEIEHQDYYQRNPQAGYCQVIIDPKLNATRARFVKFLEADTPTSNSIS